MRIVLSLLAASLISACASDPALREVPSPAQRQDFADKTAQAEAGDAVAERQIGEIYLKGGPGVFPDKDKAVTWLGKAAEAGDAQAELDMATLYERGIEIPQDFPKAHALLLQAADQGLPVAESAVGYDYLHGVGTDTDYAQALAWLQKAVKDGDATAAINLGYIYGFGLGVPKDDAAAMGWYQQAADLGNRQAQLFIASSYRTGGHGVIQDDAISQKYYALAAQGTIHSQAELGETMKEVIDAHKVYPKEAIAAKQSGNVTLGFDCPGRKPLHVKVTQSSGVPSLDAAASQAVLDSYFPDRDPSLNEMKHFVIAVDFEFTSQGAPADATAPGAH